MRSRQVASDCWAFGKTAKINCGTLNGDCAFRCSRARVRFGGYMEGLFQPMHLLLILVIALIFFGPKRLPELGKGLGDGIRALKDGMKDNSAEVKADPKPEVKPENKA
jgi:sec-independent protein translocase protein TatA